MIRSSFACNALKLRHIGHWLVRSLWFPRRRKFLELCRQSLAACLAVAPENVFLFASGRMALYTLLESLHLEPGDEVIVPGYTCVVVTNAVKYAGLQIRYVDIRPETLNLDTQAVLAAITPQTKVVVISHNFGIVYEDVDLIKKHHPHVIVVEDAAHALGSRFPDGRRAGAKGDAAFFSFEYSKPITTGLGGALVVNNPGLRPAVQVLYDTLRFPPVLATVRVLATLLAQLCTSYRYTVFLRGLAMRVIKLTGLLAATSEAEIQGERPRHYPTRLRPHLALLGFLQLREMETVNRWKNDLAQRYHAMCREINQAYDIYHPDYVYVRYPVVLPAGLPPAALERLKLQVREQTGLALGEWFNDVVHPKGSFRYGYAEHTCLVGEQMAQRIINLPVNIHTDIDQQTLEKLITIFNDNLE